MDRADRRAYEERAKAKAERALKGTYGMEKEAKDPKWIGRMASRCVTMTCHCAQCKDKIYRPEAEAKDAMRLPDSYFEG